jgi:CubicO group peptidase (beta-lactamase class C family)
LKLQIIPPNTAVGPSWCNKAAKLLFERYDNGWSRNLPHPLASGSKSFVGVLAMMAVEDGLLSLDEKAADTLTEWKDDPRKSRITVRQLLNLSSGLSPGTAEFAGGSGTNLLGFAAEQRQRRLVFARLTSGQ